MHLGKFSLLQMDKCLKNNLVTLLKTSGHSMIRNVFEAISSLSINNTTSSASSSSSTTSSAASSSTSSYPQPYPQPHLQPHPHLHPQSHPQLHLPRAETDTFQRCLQRIFTYFFVSQDIARCLSTTPSPNEQCIEVVYFWLHFSVIFVMALPFCSFTF